MKTHPGNLGQKIRWGRLRGQDIMELVPMFFFGRIITKNQPKRHAVTPLVN